LELLDRVIGRVEALLDRAIATHYGPGTVQHQTLLSRYPADRLHEATEEACALANAEAAAALRQAIETGVEPPLETLLRSSELSPLEADVFQLALAAALDAGVRKRIALFRDNVLQSFVDVDLALQLLVSDRPARLLARDIFRPQARLLRAKLLELAMPRDALTTEYLLAHELRVPSRVVSYALGHEALDEEIAPVARLTLPTQDISQIVLPTEDVEGITGLLEHYATYREDAARVGLHEVLPIGRAVVIQITGAPGTGKSMLVEAVANHLGRRLLTVSSSKLASDDRLFGDRVDKIFFEAQQRAAVLCFDGCEALFSSRNPRAPTLFRQLEEHDGIVVLVTSDAQSIDFALERWVAYHLKLSTPPPDLRDRIWRLHLPEDAPVASDVDIAALAEQFEFTGGQIRNAVLIALNRALARGGDVILDQDLLERSAQAQLRADMDELSEKTHIKLRLTDLVLPDKELRLVGEVLDAAKVRNYVLTHWGFGRRLATGRGIVCLFSGEPGTGKTLCAEILAAELERPLFRVSIPRIMSKWVGETEKNISKIFSKARASQSILLFDEADSLFTSRVKVESSVDRFANMETNLLLQEIERFDGLCILTTNHEKNIDEAFQRRIQFKIYFPFPDVAHRALIWETLIPKECPREEGIDYELLGTNFELSGGYIKNAIVRAAYRAAVDRRPISMQDIEGSAEQECKNAGKIFRSLQSAEHRSF
jgi:SpoVK/Ycf46/Vps4 family AAA+-type ATPase